MEFLFLIGGIFVFAIIKSQHNDIRRMQDQLDRHQEEFGGAIRQLQEISLNASDREVLDRLTDASRRAKQRSNYDP
ncbi:hypothetical protein [Variovorax sp. DXTD-1]|uniref:hypothetical protein n=1 Tax=Variovorax sp. DXTD-1 TaxID=2495592 RepID=UPI000F885C44|nr:hypothetical protein [Variovorax sp. DXTD-1]RST54128.1 hypothetical protein EJI00_03100 [Variovorax sp. DXTD-1]